MSDPERPPLDRRVLEQIQMLLDRVDQEHWSAIAVFQVSPAMAAKRPLPIPRTPATLLSVIQTYASMLFKREADQYGEFHRASNYAPWLWKVEERVIARVFRTIKAMEQANQPATLAYHGLTDDEIMQGLGQVLWEIRSNYVWIAGWPNAQKRATQNEANPAVAIPPASSPESVRRSLVETYRNTFPDSGIMDICWAAKQHYREWARWLKGELKDNSKPDRSFRHVLTSGKRALRKEVRPKNWK